LLLRSGGAQDVAGTYLLNLDNVGNRENFGIDDDDPADCMKKR
jgi:hypothetical protein